MGINSFEKHQDGKIRGSMAYLSPCQPLVSKVSAVKERGRLGEAVQSYSVRAFWKEKS